MTAHVSNLRRIATGLSINLRIKPQARREVLERAVAGDTETSASRISNWAGTHG